MLHKSDTRDLMNNNNVLVVFIYYFVKSKHICSTGLIDIVLDIEELFLYPATWIQTESLF